MHFVLKDYSRLCHHSALTDPPVRRSGKFVQIRKNETEYLLLSTREVAAYHANIVEQFLTEEGVEGEYNAKGDHYEIHDAGWEIIGGGVWAVNDADKVLYLSGSSQAYGRFDIRGLKEKIRASKQMADYTVRID